MSLLVPNTSIEAEYDIVQTGIEQWPFGVRKTVGGKSIIFRCRTLPEANAKLNAIAQELDRQGHKLAIA